MNKLVLFLAITFLNCYYVKGYQINSISFLGEENNIVDHSSWDKLLNNYVSDNGIVNYKRFRNDIKSLNSYINYLSKMVPSEHWSKQEKLAYFINAYNANTIKLIVDNYPTKSIKNIRNAWSKKFIKIGNDYYSLSNIEHNVLRKMDEPRIHFAINCASASCPKLLNVAYTFDNIESLLNKAVMEFIADSSKNKLSAEAVQLSKIFKWYKDDFTKYGSLIYYINQYCKIQIQQDATISYLKYNWSLNEND